MQVVFVEKKWKETAPQVVLDHKEHKIFLQNIQNLKPFDKLKGKSDFEEGRDAASNLGGNLNKFFEAMVKVHKSEDPVRKTYFAVHQKLKKELDAYQIACSNKVEELAESEASPNSGIVLKEFESVYNGVDKNLSKLNEESEKIFRSLQKARKKVEDQIDLIKPKDGESMQLIRDMNKEHMGVKQLVLSISTLSSKAEQIYASNWSPMLKAEDSLKKEDKNKVNKMQDGLQKIVHQLVHNRDEAVKLSNGMKQSILQAGQIFQGEADEHELVAGKLRRMASRVSTSLKQCETRYDFDASGRVDACEGDLKNFATFKGEEKEKWGAELKHRIPLTTSAIGLLEAELLSCEKELESTIKGFKREQLDTRNPAIRNALELVDTHTQAVVKLSKNLASYKERFAKVKQKAQELGLK